jgi:hypothetical protein
MFQTVKITIPSSSSSYLALPFKKEASKSCVKLLKPLRRDQFTHSVIPHTFHIHSASVFGRCKMLPLDEEKPAGLRLCISKKSKRSTGKGLSVLTNKR